jgi:hypothetical protein
MSQQDQRRREHHQKQVLRHVRGKKEVIEGIERRLDRNEHQPQADEERC